MTLGMAQSYPVQCRVVAWRTRLTRCACPMLCDDAGLFHDTGIYFLGILPELKKFRETQKPPEIREFSSKREEKRPVNNDP